MGEGSEIFRRFNQIKQMEKIVCFFKCHRWVEWEHNSDLPRKFFKKGTVILKNPYCLRCLLDKK